MLNAGEWKRIVFLEGQAERMRQRIEELETENADLILNLKVQAQQWSTYTAGLREEVARLRREESDDRNGS